MEKFGFYSNINALAGKCASKTDDEAIAAMTTVKDIAEGAPQAECFNKECLCKCIEQANSRNVAVATLAKETSLAICKNISPFAVKSLLPTLFANLDVEKKWPSRSLALACIACFNETAPRQLGNALPEVVPEVTACMWDTKKQVKAAATEAMKSACDVIGNKDIEHMTEKIIVAISKPKEVPEIMHEMAGVTFVQSVESPALAMVVPLLLRGLREKKTATKRQSAAVSYTHLTLPTKRIV